MAELAGFVVTVVALATEGLKIAESLATFSDRIATAPKELKALAEDVAFVSRTLEDLGRSVENCQQAPSIKGDWYKDTGDRASDCKAIFDEIQSVLDGFTGSSSDHKEPFLGKRGRLRFSISQGKIGRLQRELNALQVKFTFRLAVYRFAIDAAKDVEQSRQTVQRKELAKLQHEQALIALKIAHHNVVALNDDEFHGSNSQPKLSQGRSPESVLSTQAATENPSGPLAPMSTTMVGSNKSKKFEASTDSLTSTSKDQSAATHMVGSTVGKVGRIDSSVTRTAPTIVNSRRVQTTSGIQKRVQRITSTFTCAEADSRSNVHASVSGQKFAHFSCG
jgi:hypothetical protein